MTEEMYFIANAVASDSVPDQFYMSFEYADKAYEAFNPISTMTFTLGETLDEQSKIFLSREQAAQWMYTQYGPSAVTAINSFYGYAKFSNANRIRSDQETFLQITSQVDNLYFNIGQQLAAKAPSIHTHSVNDVSDLEARVNDFINALRNAPSGIPSLDSSGKVVSSQLPSYVDDVISYPTFAEFIYPGESGKIYLDVETGKCYRWSGLIFIEISSSDVNSVNGKIGTVTLGMADIPDLGTSLDGKVDKVTGKALSKNDFTDALKAKLDGISAGATANDTDANLKNRANHTGTQAASTISDFTEAAQDAVGASLSADFVYDDAGNTISKRARSFNNSPGRSIVTGTGATGFQVSSSRDALVNYSTTVTTAVQIGVVANVDGYVVLEIAPTNSATAGDWVEIARTPQAQNVGLAVALSSTQKGGGNLTGVVPAGYYAKIRSVNVQGTPTYAYNSGQEVLL